MITQEIPSVVVWANAADEQEIDAWIHERLHGRDRRWAEYDDGFSPLSHLVAVVANHTHTSPAASASIVQSVVRSVFSAIPEWAKTEEKILPGDSIFGNWKAPALSDLILLATEILQSAPRRAELRSFLIRMASDLPMKVGKLPLRTKALVAIVELGGNADRQFWLDQIDPNQPEATPISFLGMAKNDLDQALAWLGGQPIEDQGNVVRKLRPTLVKMAGGEIQFLVVGWRYLFRSNSEQAKKLRSELLPVEERALFLPEEELAIAQFYRGIALPPPIVDLNGISGQRMNVTVVYASLADCRLAATKIAKKRFIREFPEKKGRPVTTDRIRYALAGLVPVVFRKRNEPELVRTLNDEAHQMEHEFYASL